ncbi:GNAT family N-acetyltransferase [Aquimarina pacifica]|uniref:GNAT family N-acetyltransferase n=1 Tax=Aquimarina pacifica TaxID=1296415 RepID=UPI000470C3BB|nr:GNAT family N-acetyltransferase [Aquimarina pacifica]
MNIKILETRVINLNDILHLYKTNGWSSANKPAELYRGLINSHSLVSAWDEKKLVGIGNAISDGHLVVYYPHLLIDPKYQGKGIGQKILAKMQEKYSGFHMQMLCADGKAIDFYKKNGFEIAGETKSMWIYKGNEH